MLFLHTHAHTHICTHTHTLTRTLSLVFFPTEREGACDRPSLSLSFSSSLALSIFSQKRERRNFEVHERASCALRDIDLPTIAAVHDDDDNDVDDNDNDNVDGDGSEELDFGRAKRWCRGAA